MNWWRRLKTWQKWGIGFALAHLLLIGFFFIAVAGEEKMIIAFIDLPIVPIATKFFGKLYFNSTSFPVVYHLLLGSMLYGFIGVVAGWLVSQIMKDSTHK